jgi:heme/copper-type cytochrome/quinol oxidase subunit 2
MRVGIKLLLVTVAVVGAGVVIGFYVSNLTTLAGSPVYSVPVQNVNGHPVVNLEIETVAAVGPQLSPNPDWVSYLVKDASTGQWKRETVWDLPAHATIHVTIYNFDGASGLRNPYLARPQGMVGNRITVDGKPVTQIDPNDASHTFAVPQLGLILAVPGVADDAKNPCGYAPCPLSNAHRTIKFTFHTTAPGHYRWQCFVPCAAGWIYGFGGPMQTIGYMDGFLNVKA